MKWVKTFWPYRKWHCQQYSGENVKLSKNVQIQEGVDLMAGYGINVELMEDTVQNEDCYYGED